MQPAPPPLPWSRADAALLAAIAALAVVLTWPLCRDFTTALAGDFGDGWQTMWGFWWVGESLAAGRAPFWTDLLHHPHGVPLVFQTFVLPEALWTLPLPTPLMAHNAAALGAFVLSGWAMYGLARELTLSPSTQGTQRGAGPLVNRAQARGPAAVAALAYTFAPYHFSHALGHMHLLPMHWAALFAWALLRALRRETGLGIAAPLTGALAALAGLASPYLLLACGVVTAFWGRTLWAEGPRPGARLVAQRAGAALAGFLFVAAPWLVALPRALALGPFSGAHEAEFYSADAWAFLVPGARSFWGAWSSGLWSRFTGNAAENGVQLGWVLLALATWGAIRVRTARPLFLLAAAGVLLSLGPALHVAGEIRPRAMPWDLLVRILPLFEFSGVPVRLAFWATFALPLCAALALARFGPRASSVAAALIVLEFWPLPQPQSRFPAPAPIVAWGRSDERFTVVDLTGASRALFHSTLHHKPMIGGYTTRTPERNEAWLRETPLVRDLFFSRPGAPKKALERTDAAIDFDWGAGSPAPEVNADDFEVRWTGALQIPAAGEYELFVTSDDAAFLQLDGARIVDNGGRHPAQTRSRRLVLAAGAHPLQLDFREEREGAVVRLSWSGPGFEQEPIPAAALPGGLAGVYSNLVSESGLGQEGGRKALRDLGVRYVITAAEARLLLEHELRLPVVYEGEGLRIYEVP